MENLGKQGNKENNGCSTKPQAVLLTPRGDYQTLLSFQKAEVVYDITFRFAHKYLEKGDRTIDQMIQSARSGKKSLPTPAPSKGAITALSRF